MPAGSYRSNVLIISNTARYSGGGVYVDSMELQMRSPGSGMLFNEAQGLNDSGFGGGLMVLSDARPALAVVSSTGVSGLGIAYGNQARFGGGVAVVAGAGTSHDVNLQMFSSSASSPVAIKSNSASVSGGGLYVRSDIDVAPVPTTALAIARLWHTDIDDNAAPAGAAIHLAFDTNGLGISLGAYLYYNDGPPPSGGVPCPLEGFCGQFTFNDATTATGAVIRVGEDGFFRMPNDHGGVLFDANDGGYLLQSIGNDSASARVRNVAMVRNQLGFQLIRVQDGSSLVLADSTIAGNTVGGAEVIAVDGDITLQRTILWQPGKTSLTHTIGSRTVQEVIASETASLGNAPAAVLAPPRFVFPEGGDFQLRAASPAIDAASPDPADLGASADRDALGRMRDIRIPVVPRAAGLRRDIGAYERPALLPLVLNGDIDGSLNHWVTVTPASFEYSNDNVVGTTGSGSIWVRMNPAPSQQVVAMEQCIHVPGPGTYELNGYGHAVGFTVTSRDQLFLRWRYRSNGGEACTDGAPVGEGFHFVTSSSAWNRPPTATAIVVPEAEWTTNSSISVALVVSDTGATTPAVSGYFDGISLVLQAQLPPEIFKDGFESP